LFDQGPRTELRAAHRNEPIYNYYNRSARPEVAALRELLEGWFERIPQHAKSHLRTRFQSPRAFNHKAAFFELYLHELFLRLNFEMQVDPLAPGNRGRPDFLALRDGVPHFYMEATIAGLPSQEGRGAEARMAEVYDAIDSIESPNFFLSLELRGAPRAPVPTKRLRQDLVAWLARQDPDRIAQLYRENRDDEVPKFPWQHDGWSIDFTPLPKSPDQRGCAGLRPIGIEIPEGGFVTPHVCIRQAIERKSSKYKDLCLPYVVAVNVVADYCDNYDIMNALYGEACEEVTRGRDGRLVSSSHKRLSNGAWGTPDNPRSAFVSAALIAKDLNSWSIGRVTPESYHHPWCLRPLEPQGQILPQHVLDTSTQPPRVRHQPGREAGQILEIPSPWPCSSS